MIYQTSGPMQSCKVAVCYCCCYYYYYYYASSK